MHVTLLKRATLHDVAMITPNMSEEGDGAGTGTGGKTSASASGGGGGGHLHGTKDRGVMELDSSSSDDETSSSPNDDDGNGTADDSSAPRDGDEDDDEGGSSSDEDEDEDDEYDDVGGGGGGGEWRQHLLAVGVAAVAAILAFPHLDTLIEGFSSRGGSGGRRGATAGRGIHHRTNGNGRATGESQSSGPVYKRTSGLDFCLTTSTSSSTGSGSSEDDRMTTFCTSSLSHKQEKDCTDGDCVDTDDEGVGTLKSFEFHLPGRLVPSLLSYYLEEYDATELAGAGFLGLDVYARNASVRTIPFVAHVDPPLGSMYRDFKPFRDRQSTDVAGAGAGKDGGGDGKEEEMKEAAVEPPTFTGFAAKFVNLSPKPLDLYWDSAGTPVDDVDDGDGAVLTLEDGGGGEEGDAGAGGDGGRMKKRRKNKYKKIATVAPFEAVGTGTFPGHQFHFTPTYDSSHHVHRFVVTAEEPIVAYDPIGQHRRTIPGGSVEQYRVDKLGPDERRAYEAQLLNLAFARDYRVATGGRAWLSMFPRPRPVHPLLRADHFGRVHRVQTGEVHFHSLPPKSMLGPLDPSAAAIGPGDGVALPEYRNLKKRDGHQRQGGGQLTLELTAISCRPAVFEIPNFLSDAEVEHLLDLAANGSNMTRSTVSASSAVDADGEPRARQSDRSTRSSRNGWVARHASPIVDAVYRRAADVVGVDESLLRHRYGDGDDDGGGGVHGGGEYLLSAEQSSRAENLQMVHYQVGQQYTAHHDFTFPPARNPYQPTRFATLLLYLNDDFDGGETVFPKAMSAESRNGLQVLPEKGKAVLFYSVLPDGNMDDLSQHASLPVRKGEKWLANLWMWDPVID